jgi:cystathionine beta-lyase/cystathionine gamma-synthase
MKMATRLAHTGIDRDERTGAISTPIYQSATFRHPGLGQSTGFDYSRSGNPTRQMLEECICRLEGGKRGLAFASGMAAITTLLLNFRPGDHFLVTDDLYGGTYRLMTTIGSQFGLQFTFCDLNDPQVLAANTTAATRAVFIETPTNPLMKIIDLQAVIGYAKEHGLLAIVDNTFLTPYLQRPLELGADLVVHSASKFVGGHNDVVAGLLVSGDEQLGEQLATIQNSAGAVLGPQDSWLLLRGLKTLAARMEWSQNSALRLAHFLSSHPAVKRVYYPGLPTHPGHSLCQRQSSGFGAVLSFEVAGQELVPKLLSGLKFISFAESLGGVESLITYPETQTHADMPAEIRQAAGISDCLLRLSVGLEDPADLQQDLEQALGAQDGQRTSTCTLQA